jgi:hypothetical protein
MAAAQDATATPPKVLQIIREPLKLGKSSQGHDRVGATFTSIAARAKQRARSIGLDSMSGRARYLWITGYPSFDAWEKDSNLIWSNAALATEMDHAIAAEGEFAEEVNFEVFTYNEDWSFHPNPDLAHARYVDITILHIRGGHRKDFNDCMKMIKDGNGKAGNAAHWAAYEIAYGGEGNTVIGLTHRTSLAEIDKDLADGKKFAEAIGGEDGMQKLDEVCGAGVDSMRTELFSINPKQSYADESWIKADPDFWKPRKGAPESATAKPAAPKPTPASGAKPGGR